MKQSLIFNTGKWFVVGTLMLLISITTITHVSAAALTDADVASLTFMREEEKLARDVYIFLYSIWGSTIFDNISNSEQTHMDAIKTLLDRYGIADPASKVTGVFNNTNLQSLYNTLTAQGSLSLIDALEVGALIEETDIDDLAVEISSTSLRDIKRVYSNLMQGSMNHLEAFISNLAMLGVTYEQ